MEENTTYTGKVTLCDDGKYRWVYEVNLLKNPMFFWLIYKIFLLILLGGFAIMGIADLANWGAEKVVQNLPFCGYALAGMTAVVVLGYLIYAAIMGGKYIVTFEMDEKGFCHRQIDAQAEKARKIGAATMLAGGASKNAGMIGVGIAAQRTEMYTEFSKVRKVKAYPARHTIKVREGLEHNQIYAAKEDFPFVLEYISSHCPNAKQ